METIRKTICIDDYKSHRAGTMPYIKSDSRDPYIYEVKPSNENGNYGQFVCDLTFNTAESYVTTIGSDDDIEEYTITKRTEKYKLNYLDTLRKYRESKECIKNSIVVKKISAEAFLGENNGTFEYSDCLEGSTVPEIVFWTTKFNEDVEPYIPAPIDYSLFDFDGSKYTIRDYSENDRADYISEVVNNSAYLRLMTDFGTFAKLEEEWDSKWGEIGECTGSGKTDFLTDYISHDYYVFVQDVERHFIGMASVPQQYNGNDIVGNKVPNNVYYTEVAPLITQLTGGNERKKGWANLGGNSFNEFLRSGATPVWNTIQEPANSGSYISYAKPCIEVPILITDDSINEMVYTPYLYSASGNDMWMVEKPYDPNIYYNNVDEYNEDKGTDITEENFNELDMEDKIKSISSLSPHFIEFEAPIKVESKLDNVLSHLAVYATDKIYGIYEPFTSAKTISGRATNVEVGQLYRCVFNSGTSMPHTVSFQSGYTIDMDNFGNRVIKINKTEQVEESGGEEPMSSAYQVTGIKKWVISSDDSTPIVESEVNGKTSFWSSTTIYGYSWWDCEPVNTSGIRCADGEFVPSNSNVYRNAVIVGCIDGMVSTASIGDYYYIMAKYNNGRINTAHTQSEISKGGDVVSFKIPYVVDEICNAMVTSGICRYDVLSSTGLTEDSALSLTYIIGAISGDTGIVSGTGIYYNEVFDYEPNVLTHVYLDNGCYSELYYDKYSDTDSVKSVYSEELGLSRVARIANIIGMEVGGEWTSETATDTLLFTKEGLNSLQEEPIYDINATFDRGMAAAWESHFKLSECNTMEDLENYGNNFFNI